MCPLHPPAIYTCASSNAQHCKWFSLNINCDLSFPCSCPLGPHHPREERSDVHGDISVGLHQCRTCFQWSPHRYVQSACRQYALFEWPTVQTWRLCSIISSDPYKGDQQTGDPWLHQCRDPVQPHRTQQRGTGGARQLLQELLTDCCTVTICAADVEPASRLTVVQAKARHHSHPIWRERYLLDLQSVYTPL